MQQNIIFKNIDGKVTIIANENMSFESFIKSLKSRLDRLYIKDNLLKANMTLDIKNIPLDSKKILSLFDVFSEFGFICIDKIIYKENKDKNIVLYENNIRSGEIKLFSSNTLLIGSINKGAKVIVNGNLYVIGKASGFIEFKNIKNKLMASSIEDLYVKICSFQKMITGQSENVIVSVEGNEIKEGNFVDRRDRIYGKSNCSYIW